MRTCLPTEPRTPGPDLAFSRYCCVGLSCLLSGCFWLAPSKGGGEIDETTRRRVDAADVAVPEGYRVEVVARGLTFPTAVALDDADRIHVVEAGYSYGEKFGVARLLRLEGGRFTTLASSRNGPWTGIAYHGGNFYIAEGGHAEGGRILRVAADGKTTVLADKLPNLGDHHVNGPAVGRDGYLYFGEGTATNSGVVGRDNAELGWLKRHPKFHDVPCRDVTLAGINFESESALAEGKAMTGAYLPYGTASTAQQTITGQLPCSGAVLRVPLQGGKLELVAWGLRNPYGLAFAPDGVLYATENAYDERGSRPVFGAGDVLWRIERGAWYGWPDYAEGRPIDSGYFDPPGGPALRRLLAAHPSKPPDPIARFAVHSSSNGFDFSRSARFGYVGQAFVAQFGDQAPKVGKTLNPVGFKVIRVDVKTGVSHDFAVNPGDQNGPASKLGSGGLERPVSARFSRDGDELYVVDFGVMTVSEEGFVPVENSGVLWRIRRGS